MSVFIITGAFACAAALNNAGLRYTYALGREGLLPKALGRTHPKHKTPHIAVFTQGAIALAIVLIFRFAGHTGLDVYYWIAVQGVIWIILVQALTSLAVWAYFRRQPAERAALVEDDGGAVDRLPRADPGALPLLQVPELARAPATCSTSRSSARSGRGAGSRSTSPGWGSSACSCRWPPWSTPSSSAARNPAKYERAGRFINEGDVVVRDVEEGAGRRRPPRLRPRPRRARTAAARSSGSPGTSTPSSAAVPIVNAHTPRSASARIRSAESTDPAAITGSDVAPTTASTSASTSPS